MQQSDDDLADHQVIQEQLKSLYIGNELIQVSGTLLFTE